LSNSTARHARLDALDTSNVSCRVISRRDEPSGIWAYSCFRRPVHLLVTSGSCSNYFVGYAYPQRCLGNVPRNKALVCSLRVRLIVLIKLQPRRMKLLAHLKF